LNLRNEIEKDSKQFFRERRTLVLLFAAPIIVILILGGVFGRTSAEIGGTEIGLCDMDNSSISTLFVSGIKNSSKVTDYSGKEECDYLVEKDVTGGRLAAAIVIPEGLQRGIEKGESQNITVFIDNSRIQTAPSIEAFMKAAIQETGQKIGTEFILRVWGRLDGAANELDGLLDDVNESRDRAFVIRGSLQETADTLEAINLTVVENELVSANSTIIDVLESLDYVEANLTEIESDFAQYDYELNQSESELVYVNNTISNISFGIAEVKSGINCSDPFFAAYCLSLDSLESTLAPARISIGERITRIRNAREGLAEANLTIQEFRRNIMDAREGAGDAETRIENMQEFLYGIERSRDASLGTIYEVNSSVNELIEKSYELEDIIVQSSAQIREITSRTPESVVSPILLSANYPFGRRTFFDFLLPSLLPMIVMFVSLFLAATSLVREKNGGTLRRIELSQVNPLEYTAKKVISYTVVLIPEAVLLILVASLFYGAFPIFDIGTVFFVFETLVLLLLAFTAIGVLIAVYSESEATAFLASLVVGLPLLFLSGLVFPFEFMPSTIALAGQASPLTQAVLSMQSVILYHSPQPVGFGILLVYAVLFTLLAALSMKRIR
jgi:ABC-2 type transport system permease protein